MDRIGDSAKKGLDFLRSRALETVEVQKLSGSIKKLEERRHNCLLELGHLALAAYGTPDLTDETFRVRVEEIEALEQELAAAQKEHHDTVEQLRQSMGDLLPKRPGSSPIPAPEYDDL